MATREQSVFEGTSVLFKPASSNLNALQTTSIAHYLHNLPGFSSILAQLKSEGLFLHLDSVEYSVENFLEHHANLSRVNLDRPAVELISEPIYLTLNSSDLLTDIELIPHDFLELSDKIECYISLIVDVIHNQLAQKPYEKLSDREDVTEQEHALQAGKIAYLLKMPLGEILALLLHDVARPSINNPEHGHANHSQEGSTILSPLELPIDFSGAHTFAKYLLYKFSPLYKNLISAASKHTLSIQTQFLASEAEKLKDLTPRELAVTIYQLMLMRLIDDMSKVSSLALNQQLDDERPDYFDPLLIKQLLKQQMNLHLRETVDKSSDLPKAISKINEQLDDALLLLLRAKDYSNDPKLYEQFHQVIESISPSERHRQEMK